MQSRSPGISLFLDTISESYFLSPYIIDVPFFQNPACFAGLFCQRVKSSPIGRLVSCYILDLLLLKRWLNPTLILTEGLDKNSIAFKKTGFDLNLLNIKSQFSSFLT